MKRSHAVMLYGARLVRALALCGTNAYFSLLCFVAHEWSDLGLLRGKRPRPVMSVTDLSPCVMSFRVEPMRDAILCGSLCVMRLTSTICNQPFL